MVVKRVWLLTHDQRIDRRIFFFEDVFRNLGFETRLFASRQFDTTTEADAASVVRPVKRIVAKQYGVSKAQMPPLYADTMAFIISGEEQYRKKHGVYTNKLAKMGIRLKELPCAACEILSGDKLYFILLQFGEGTVMYNSYTQQYTISQYTTIRKYWHQAHPYEVAMYRYGLMEEPHAHESMDGINLRRYSTDDGNAILDMNDPQFPLIYTYDYRDQVLYEESPLPLTFDAEDTLGGRRYPFKDFRDSLHNYSPVLSMVKTYLEKEQPDFVYVADLPTLPIGIILKDFCGCKLIIDCHEWWHRQLQLWNTTEKKAIALAEEYERILYAQCDLRITVGKHLAAAMQACYDQSFETVYSCLDAELSAAIGLPSDGFWQTALGIPEGVKVALFQGSMDALRNLDNLARATAYLKNKQALVIVGGGPYEEEFRGIVEKEGNPDAVFYTGWVTQGKLMEYTVNADLGVLPYVGLDDYFSVSTPNKLMEYYAAGLPFLYDDSMKEISSVAKENGVGVAADLRNPKAFGEAMASLLADDLVMKGIKDQYQIYGSHFSYGEQRTHFENILHQYFDLHSIDR